MVVLLHPVSPNPCYSWPSLVVSSLYWIKKLKKASLVLKFFKFYLFCMWMSLYFYCLFSVGLFGFCCCFNILYINSYLIYNFQVFCSPFGGCLFILLIVSFVKQECLVRHLTLFALVSSALGMYPKEKEK